MAIREGIVSPDLMREIAAGLRVRAAMQDRSLLGLLRRNEMSLDAAYLDRMAAAGATLHVLESMPLLPGMTEAEEPRRVSWPRLEDGADGGRR